jgi:GAF domain-containing protein
VSGEDHQELGTSVTSLGALLMRQQPLTTILTSVAAYAADAIPGADGAGLTLLEDGRADTIVASEPFVVAVDEVQYRLGEGPCLSAVASACTQLSACLGGEDRWPRFGPRASRLGVHSALSLPLLIDGGVIGALNVYGRRLNSFDEGSVRAGESFAQPAAVTVANAQVLEESRRLAALLERAIESRTVTDYAIGIIMSRTGATPDQALTQLRQLSQATSTKLAVVAAQLVDQAVGKARHRHAHHDRPTSGDHS